MSLAIKFGDSSQEGSLFGVLYFDVVTNYNKTKSGKVTEHPIEAGGLVSDHYISDNPVYEVSGAFSHIDLSTVPQTLMIDGEFAMNANLAPSPTTIGGANGLGGLRGLIPDVVGQFLLNGNNEVFVDRAQRVNYSNDIEEFISDLMNGISWNSEKERWENNMTTATLYDVEGVSAINPIGDLVLVSFKINEDADTGDAMMVDFVFHQVMFVTHQDAEAPKPKKNTSDGRKQTSTKDKGNNPSPSKRPEQESKSVMGELGKSSEVLKRR